MVCGRKSKWMLASLFPFHGHLKESISISNYLPLDRFLCRMFETLKNGVSPTPTELCLILLSLVILRRSTEVVCLLKYLLIHLALKTANLNNH